MKGKSRVTMADEETTTQARVMVRNFTVCVFVWGGVSFLEIGRAHV